MRVLFFSLLTTLLVAPASAQQQPSPIELALGQRVMAEVNANVQASAMIVDLQRQLAATQARVKALEEKYEPKKSDPPEAAPK